MKNIILSLFSTLAYSIAISQPALTVWITPDGYQSDHNHSASQQYWCDSSYYIFYHTNPDTLFINLKNEGNENLDLSAINSEGLHGANFTVLGFSSQLLLPGEMYTVKLLYQLPPQYFNGINGNISFVSNDPNKPLCFLYFDIGCLAQWRLITFTEMGTPGGCDDPVISVVDAGTLLSPNMLFNDSMKFFSYDSASNTSQKVMHLLRSEVHIPENLSVAKTFTAGNVFNPMGAAFEVFSDEVRVNKPFYVEGDVQVLGTLEVDLLTNPSDSRKKKEIDPIEGALQKVLLLGPKSYFMLDSTTSTKQQYGFIAQELEETLPNLVHQNTGEMKSVNYIQLIPWLAAAIQEQQQWIIHLQEEIDELKKE